MAVTAREQQMIDLADAGLNARQIAGEMGIKPDSVKRTLDLLTNGLGIDRKHISAMASGSNDLKQAVVALGGHH